MVKVYEVGGSVRDRLLGYIGTPNDIDYAVEAESYQEMKQYLVDMGIDFFLERPEYGTIRGRLGLAADWVLCRTDGYYSDGRRPDTTEVGTIYDDLARRDFTMNAIAIHQIDAWREEIIDPFNGKKDIEERIIRCVGKTEDRMREDALRMIRAIRFSITKNMRMATELYMFLSYQENVDLLKNISEDRIREELAKCFKFDTLRTLDTLCAFYLIRDFIFSNTKIWLLPTMEKK